VKLFWKAGVKGLGGKGGAMSRVSGQVSGGTGWTIKTVSQPARGPVTKSTVTELKRNKSLRDVAKVAKKYAK